MYAKKVINFYAIVTDQGLDYRVYPNGSVYVWTVNDYNVEGYWAPYDSWDYNYDEISKMGLMCLDGE